MLTNHIIDIFSKVDLIAFLRKIDKLENTVLISILDPDDRFEIPKKLLNKVDDHITVRFWDITCDKASKQYSPIDLETAKQIAKFIDKNRNKKFIIHCTAGVSRSAGVGLAIECILDMDGDTHQSCLIGCPGIIGNPRFSPNYCVFDKIIQAFKSL